jgi:hypothetical protein
MVASITDATSPFPPWMVRQVANGDVSYSRFGGLGVHWGAVEQCPRPGVLGQSRKTGSHTEVDGLETAAGDDCRWCC